MSTAHLYSSFHNTNILFGDFVLDPQSGELLRAGEIVKIEPRLLTFLLLLIKQKESDEHPIVTRELMVEQIWEGKTVSDDAVRAVVKKLREVLGDNAKKPTYVKTIPTKGYLFVCNYQVELTGSDLWKTRFVKYGVFAAVIALVTILFQVLYYWFTAVEVIETREAVVTTITQDVGAQVSAYKQMDSLIAFVDKPELENSLQLYVKNTESEQVRRLSWSDHLSISAIWNVDVDQVFVSRKLSDDETQYALLEIAVDSVTVTNEPSAPIISLLTSEPDFKIVSWSRDNTHLYALKQFPNVLDGAGSIHQINIQDATTQQLLVLDNSVKEVFALSESPNNQYLGLVYRSENDESNLMIYSLTNQQKVYQALLPVQTANIHWSEDSNRVSFADQSGSIWSYHIETQKLAQWQGFGKQVKTLVADCGQSCFIITEHNGDYLDIQEVPFPFDTAEFLSTQIIASDDVDSLPNYNGEQDIVFVSTNNKKSLLNRLSPGQEVKSIFELPTSGLVSSLTTNQQGTAVVGEIDKRIFLYRLDTNVFSFVTSVRDNASKPNWLVDGSGFTYVAQHKTQSQNLPTPELTNNATELFHYELDSSSKRLLSDRLIAIQKIDANRYLLVDATGVLYTVNAESITAAANKFNDNQSLVATQQTLPSVHPNRWKVMGQTLYFTDYQNNLMHLNKLNLVSYEFESTQVNDGNNELEFDINDQQTKLLTVSNKKTKQNLIQVEGVWQASETLD